MRTTLKDVKGSPVSEPFKKVVVTYFNTILGNTSYWTDPTKLKEECDLYFTNCLFPDEKNATFDLRQGLDLSSFFARLCKLSGIKVRFTSQATANNSRLTTV